MSNYVQDFAGNLPKHDCMSIVHNFHRVLGEGMAEYIENSMSVFATDKDRIECVAKNSIWVMNVYLGGKGRTYAAPTLAKLYEFAGNVEGKIR